MTHPSTSSKVEIVAQKLGHRTVVATDGVLGAGLIQVRSARSGVHGHHDAGDGWHQRRKKIRELSASKWTPIIFYSALDRMQDIVSGLEAGGDDYLVKPASTQY
jgi:DNA-binding response OmpR family regulator